MSEFFYDPKSSDLQALNAVRGMERLARMAEAMEGEEYDVELRYMGQDPKPLFSVREMSWKGGSAFGIRHDESGMWFPFRYASRYRAELSRDGLLLAWCCGDESILVEGFAILEDVP